MEENQLIKSIPVIKLKSKLKKHYNYEHIKKLLVDELNKIPELQTFRHDINLILVICNIIETMLKTDKKLNINKDTLCIDIMSELFEDYKEEDKEAHLTQIEFLTENHQIKAYSRWSAFRKRFKSFFFCSLY